MWRWPKSRLLFPTLRRQPLPQLPAPPPSLPSKPPPPGPATGRASPCSLGPQAGSSGSPGPSLGEQEQARVPAGRSPARQAGAGRGGLDGGGELACVDSGIRNTSSSSSSMVTVGPGTGAGNGSTQRHSRAGCKLVNLQAARDWNRRQADDDAVDVSLADGDADAGRCEAAQRLQRRWRRRGCSQRMGGLALCRNGRRPRCLGCRRRGPSDASAAA
ncbi:hypothetical protein PLESTF_001896000 [Pleodorina starrii]|nr:hypothetical protein PLESTF_001896000 [Pleodorina starrii]